MSLLRRNFLLVMILAAWRRDPPSGAAVPGSGQRATARIQRCIGPDFSGMWVHGSIPGSEPLASGSYFASESLAAHDPTTAPVFAIDWSGPESHRRHGA